jgi:hypothetical protein
MKAEQVVTFVYVLLALVFAYVSNILMKSFSNLFFAVAIPFLLYGLSIGPLIKLGKMHPKKMLVSNSLVTFFFIWLVAWIIFYNF